jgi:hypothetical protein
MLSKIRLILKYLLFFSNFEKNLNNSFLEKAFFVVISFLISYLSLRLIRESNIQRAKEYFEYFIHREIFSIKKHNKSKQKKI